MSGVPQIAEKTEAHKVWNSLMRLRADALWNDWRLAAEAYEASVLRLGNEILGNSK